MAQMHWYTTCRNSVIVLSLNDRLKQSVVVGNETVCQALCDTVRTFHARNKRPCLVGLDGYLGENWKPLVDRVIELLTEEGLCAETIEGSRLYRSDRWMDRLIRRYTDSDPSLGTVCSDKRVKDLLEPSKIAATRQRLSRLRRSAPPELAAVFCYGIGTGVPALRSLYDNVYFYDMGRVAVMMKKFAHALREPFKQEPEADLYWKKEMYFYYHVLDKHRQYLLNHIDGYVDANDEDNLKLIPRGTFDHIVTELSRRPLTFRRYMQPGNWGGVHHAKHFDLPQLKNCAWDTTFYAPKNNCLVDVGIGSPIEIPFLNIQLKHPRQVVGPYLARRYPGLLPMIACIDDGYFPKPVHHERSNMPVHLHPDGAYARRTFNERLGRYETYYIVEAYENANTMLGLKEGANAEEFKKRIIEADRDKKKFDWTEYVKTWPSEEGDLYLIPAGTVHGTGGHQMILEMDTCPSNVGTEYSFFIYDFLRPSWDDDKKTFSAPPVRLQIEHGLKQARWYRTENWVRRNLLAKPSILRKGRDWSEDRYASYGPMPFEIERLHFEKTVTTTTHGRFCHLLTLTKGDKVLIRSKKHPERAVEIEWIQLCLIPAGFGEYDCINIGTSEACTLVRQRWKQG